MRSCWSAVILPFLLFAATREVVEEHERSSTTREVVEEHGGSWRTRDSLTSSAPPDLRLTLSCQTRKRVRKETRSASMLCCCGGGHGRAVLWDAASFMSSSQSIREVKREKSHNPAQLLITKIILICESVFRRNQRSVSCNRDPHTQQSYQNK